MVFILILLRLLGICSVADVLEAFAASIFRVEVCRVRRTAGAQFRPTES
jgi:hypothetical protein